MFPADPHNKTTGVSRSWPTYPNRSRRSRADRAGTSCRRVHTPPCRRPSPLLDGFSSLVSCREPEPPSVAVSPNCHDPSSEMASFPGLCKAVGPAEEENGELDGSLQQMLKAIADERNRLNLRQEISGLGELL